MNKKGVIVFNMLQWIFRIFFLVVVLFTLFFLIRSFIVTELDVFNAESDIFIQRLLLSRNGFSYVDEDLGRVYPGIIDINRFMSPEIEKEINDSIYYGESNKKVAASITLKDAHDDTIRSIYYNPQYYFRWNEMLEAQWLKGPGGVTSKSKRYVVLIKNNSLEQGILEIKAIFPNS